MVLMAIVIVDHLTILDNPVLNLAERVHGRMPDRSGQPRAVRPRIASEASPKLTAINAADAPAP